MKIKHRNKNEAFKSLKNNYEAETIKNSKEMA